MRHYYYRSTIFFVIFAFLVGCRMFHGEGLFKLQPSDDAITAAVHEALKTNKDLAPFQFHVETAKGNVFLSGYVKTIRQSDTAEDLTGKVGGVISVENNIIVRK